MFNQLIRLWQLLRIKHPGVVSWIFRSGSQEASVKVSAGLCSDLKALLGEFLPRFIQALSRADLLMGV